MLINRKYHLTHCSNIFKEKCWKYLFFKLQKYISRIKQIANKKKLGISLCMSNKLVNTLYKKKNILNFKKWLDKENVYVSSINGFVYRNFHEENIKEKIYYPDWSSQKRTLYTIKLIKILTFLKKNIKSLSISTVPISYSFWIKKKHRIYLFYQASKNILKVIPELLNAQNIHLDIEPEPDCILNDLKTFILFFNNWLIPVSRYETTVKTKEIKFYIRLCYDICHFSVVFEDHKKAIFLLKKNKIKIGKIQVSSALEIKIPENKFNKKYLLQHLLTIRKSSFLHQVTEKNNNTFINYRDIQYSFKNFSNKTNNILRIHCHTPIYRNIINKLPTTQFDTYNALQYLLLENNINHIEIETYTHDLLSDENKFDSMMNEYNWLINIINKHENTNKIN